MARRPTYDFEASIGFWVLAASHALERALNEELAPLGVTYRQWQVLAALVYREDACQAELARCLRVEAPTLAGILNRMERDGWIERCVCASDRRRNEIRLTSAVRPVWREMAACARRVRRRAMRGVGAADFEVAKDVLGRVRANLDPIEEEAR